MMKSEKARPKSISEYINAAPRQAQKKLREMRVAIRSAAPRAEEGIKYGIPAFSYRKLLVAFAAYEKHIGFYPTPSGVKAFAKELSSFKTAKGSIQFPLEKPLPLGLVRKITKFRVRESVEGEKKWRT